ncbi:MAG: nucleoside hydrolase [Opitutaceae bacterium]|nr:nucleoside hydrolase [Opitutaceae bacterium]
MRYLKLILCVLASAPFLSAAPLPVIFDTDMDSDVDDVAALAQLHVMADRGEIELLAVMVSGRNEWSAPCIDSINTFYGRPDLPIGLVSGKRGIRQNSAFARQVAEAFPQDFKTKHKQIESAALYRRLLAARSSADVVIVSVGDLTNMAALLDSKSDAASPLGGEALVAAKVAHYVCMGSRYPAETDPGKNKWGNFRTDPESTREVNDRWPTMLTFTGGGPFADSMAIGREITKLDPQVWPVSLAYRSYFGASYVGKVRHTADSIAVLVAVRGFDPFFKVVDRGSNHIDEIGRNAWSEEPDAPNRRYTSELKNPGDAPKVAALFEKFAMTPPKGGLPAPAAQ